MATQQKDPPSKAQRDAEARATREAEALRANLRRRKAQAQARKTLEPRKVQE